MQIFVILVAVLLSVQAATVPQVITHKVTAPIPNNVLAPSPEMEREVPAMVVEVTKDHKHNPDMPLHSVAVVPSVHPVDGVVLSLPDVMVTTAQPIEVPVVRITTVSPVVNEVSKKVPVQPAEVPGVMVSMVTSETPVVKDAAKVPVQHVIKERSLDDETPEEGSGHVVNIEPVVDVVTMLLEDVEVTTNLSEQETTTVQVEDEDDISTTMVPLLDDVVEVKEVSTVDPVSMDNVTDLVAEEVVTVVAVHGHDHLVPVTEVVHVHSTEKSSEDSSDEEDDSSSSSSESPKDLLVPEILNHAHSKDEVTVPHVPVSPPINVDTRDQSSSSSSEEVNEDVQETVRHRRAVPFSDKINLATAPCKLVTDPKVIANILSKSNTVKLHRAMRSVVEDEKTAMTVDGIAAPVSVSEPVDARENVDKTPVSVTVLEPVTKTDDPMMPSMVTINPCDLLCTKFEIDPICASNGLCLHEFPNQCMLDTYNCKHPREKFSATRDERCQMSWLDFCKESDLV